MKTSLFDFILPEQLIATKPLSQRDAARMLVVGRELQDKMVNNLTNFLRVGDVMVFNDTKVIPARMIGFRGSVKIEILLHKNLGRGNWQCFAKPGKRLRVGDIITFAGDFSAHVAEKYDDGQVSLYFSDNDEIFRRKLEIYGSMPLPPYIERSRHADESDNSNYQTVYAKHAGSVAAPTAGLHFTEKLLAAVDAAGVKRVHVTLHVGGGTFLPVKTEDVGKHVMHSESAVVTSEVADIVNSAKQAGGRVIGVGTTSVRTLESACDEQGMLREFAGETDIFITPGYSFKIVDVMLTNFHLPKSTLFMLVSAFCGLEKMQAAYAHAIRENYRFYSYGDACLLFKR
jgi:S-adenosylmethionine:tRNA ribosyltransferase-isomerase